MLGVPAPDPAKPTAPPQAQPINAPSSPLPVAQFNPAAPPLAVAQFNPAALPLAAESPGGLIWGILSCVLGVVSSVLVCFVPPLLPFLLILAGVVLGVHGIVLGKSNRTKNLGVAGVVLCALGPAVLLVVLMFSGQSSLFSADPDVEAAKKAVAAESYDPSSVQFTYIEHMTYDQRLVFRVRGTWKVQSGRTVEFDYLCIAHGKPGDPASAGPNPRGDNWRDPSKK